MWLSSGGKSTSSSSLDYYVITSSNELEDAHEEMLLLDTHEPQEKLYFDRLDYFAPSYKTKDGLYLRGIFVMENIGNAPLDVYQIMFDGEPCFSQGIRAAYCKPFSIGANENALLDIR